MRIRGTVAGLILMALWASSWAQASLRRAQQADIDQAVKHFADGCRANSKLNVLHDCKCLTEQFRSMANAIGQPVLPLGALAQVCPAAKKTTYDWVFTTCDDYMRNVRTDHESFCGCAAERFATSYLARPNSLLRQVDALRRDSMVACGLADRTHAIGR